LPRVAQNSKLAVYAAVAANLAIGATKLVAFAVTGSSAMLTEAIHSFVDTGNGGLLLFGMKRAARPPDDTHPFGYGMEAFFWSFVVALMIFALGGAAAIWEGVAKIRRPEPITRAWINFVVIAAAMAFEGASLFVAVRELRAGPVGRAPLLRSIRRSKDPSLFAVVLEDSAALAGLVLAALGVAGSALLGWPRADGFASVGIGCLLVAVAAFLAGETRSLLTGEAASPKVVGRIRAVLVRDPAVVAVKEILSMHLGPQEILVAVTLDFRDDLPAGDVERRVAGLVDAVRGADPRITRVFMRPG
jgi:cation diffusion facilitator family transporter